jgi:ribosome biogenesis GTPase
LPYSSLAPLGWGDRWTALLADVDVPDATPARVVRHDGSAVLVTGPDGPAHLPVRATTIAGADGPPVVGDWVAVAGGAVVAVLPRSSLLRRRAAGSDAPQALAANLDLLLIVCGLDRARKPGRIQRAVTLAWDAGAAPLVVLTKADLVPDAEEATAGVAAAVPAVDIVSTSSVDGTGIDELRRRVRDRTVALLGESGAGKSTLVNALVGADVAVIGDVREGDAKGRHTTTSRQLHLLPGGGVLVDTPGIREVGLWADADAVDAAFPDIDELSEGCRFNDCAHTGEPGCEVAAAVEDGRLAPERLASWAALRQEATAAALRADRAAAHAANRRFGRMAREAQRRKGRT